MKIQYRNNIITKPEPEPSKYISFYGMRVLGKCHGTLNHHLHCLSNTVVVKPIQLGSKITPKPGKKPKSIDLKSKTTQIRDDSYPKMA